jgi:hypothetical protein
MEKTKQDNEKFASLIDFLKRVPAINKSFFGYEEENGLWWIKFGIEINHKLAWNTVQEFGHIVNYVSVSEKLPTKFYPVSPPPYMNGGPDEFLSWIIENTDKDFSQDDLKEWLESRLPNPVEDESEWIMDDE